MVVVIFVVLYAAALICYQLSRIANALDRAFPKAQIAGGRVNPDGSQLSAGHQNRKTS